MIGKLTIIAMGDELGKNVDVGFVELDGLAKIFVGLACFGFVNTFLHKIKKHLLVIYRSWNEEYKMVPAALFFG